MHAYQLILNHMRAHAESYVCICACLLFQVKIAIAYKHGGFYMDVDNVVIRDPSGCVPIPSRASLQVWRLSNKYVQLCPSGFNQVCLCVIGIIYLCPGFHTNVDNVVV